jgi:hypothetical protein
MYKHGVCVNETVARSQLVFPPTPAADKRASLGALCCAGAFIIIM